ncbi:MAG: type II secretion system protein GspM [Desulfatibacillaceae bacterium]
MAKLGKSEKRLVALAVMVICAIVLVEFVITPVLERRKRLENSVARAQNDLADIQILAQDYARVMARSSQAANRLDRRPAGFSLFSFLDTLAGQAGVKSHLAYMNPSASPVPESPFRRSQVDLKLQRISMEQLMQYLYRIESSDNEVFVRRMKITRTGKDEPYVDAVIQVVTLELAA